MNARVWRFRGDEEGKRSGGSETGLVAPSREVAQEERRQGPQLDKGAFRAVRRLRFVEGFEHGREPVPETINRHQGRLYKRRRGSERRELEGGGEGRARARARGQRRITCASLLAAVNATRTRRTL